MAFRIASLFLAIYDSGGLTVGNEFQRDLYARKFNGIVMSSFDRSSDSGVEERYLGRLM